MLSGLINARQEALQPAACVSTQHASSNPLLRQLQKIAQVRNAAALVY